MNHERWFNIGDRVRISEHTWPEEFRGKDGVIIGFVEEGTCLRGYSGPFYLVTLQYKREWAPRVFYEYQLEAI